MKRTILTAILTASLSQALYAELITIQASGYLQSVEGVLNNEFVVGETFTYTYTYDSAAIDTEIDFRRGAYWGAIGEASLTVNDYSMATAGGFMFVDNEFSVGIDSYVLGISGSQGDTLSGNTVGGKIPGSISIALDDTDGLAFSNDDLPADAPDLALFENKLLTLQFADEVHSYGLVGVDRVYGKVTSIAAIPEPGVLGLMTLFGGGLWAIRRWFLI